MTSNTTRRARDGANEIQREVEIWTNPSLPHYQNVLLFAPRLFPCRTSHGDLGSVYITPVKIENGGFTVKTYRMFSVHTTQVKFEFTELPTKRKNIARLYIQYSHWAIFWAAAKQNKQDGGQKRRFGGKFNFFNLSLSFRLRPFFSIQFSVCLLIELSQPEEVNVNAALEYNVFAVLSPRLASLVNLTRTV